MAKIKKAQFLVARKEMEDDIVEYTWNIPVGCGQFDRIKIHRVIRERSSGIPERCNIGLMMLHGDFSDFSSIFMQSGMAAFLADHGIDVWGADRRWTAVTSEALGDGSFMCDWNTAKYLQDLRIALNFARTVRLITGSGRGRMFLCGHSSGANLCYACANEETKAIEPSRNVKGLVAIDTVHKFDPVETQLIQDAEARYNALCAMREDGKCFSDDALTLKTLAVLAKTDPEGTSPVIPPLNNEQAAIFVLAATYATYSPPIMPIVPAYHYNAGIFDPETQLPSGLQLAALEDMIAFAESVPPYQAINDLIDLEAILSNNTNKFADHLSDIKIPIFYIGAAGGIGEYGQYTVDQIGSNDKTTKMVSIPGLPGEINYGHIDLIFARDAAEEVWLPIVQWIKNRA